MNSSHNCFSSHWSNGSSRPVSSHMPLKYLFREKHLNVTCLCIHAMFLSSTDAWLSACMCIQPPINNILGENIVTVLCRQCNALIRYVALSTGNSLTTPTSVSSPLNCEHLRRKFSQNISDTAGAAHGTGDLAQPLQFFRLLRRPGLELNHFS